MAATITRGGVRWEAAVTSAQRQMRGTLGALLQHRRKWEALLTDSQRTLNDLVNTAAEQLYLAQHIALPGGSAVVLHARLHEANARERDRHVQRLRKQCDRLHEAAEGMRSAAAGAALCTQSAADTLGREWADTLPLFRSLPPVRMCALAERVAERYAAELELKRALVADLDRLLSDSVDVRCTREDVLAAYLAAWIMRPTQPAVGDDTVDAHVRMITEELGG